MNIIFTIGKQSLTVWSRIMKTR